MPFYPEGMAPGRLCVLLCGFPCCSQQAPIVHTAKSVLPDSANAEASTPGQQTDQQPSGSITGIVAINPEPLTPDPGETKREGQTTRRDCRDACAREFAALRSRRERVPPTAIPLSPRRPACLAGPAAKLQNQRAPCGCDKTLSVGGRRADDWQASAPT